MESGKEVLLFSGNLSIVQIISYGIRNGFSYMLMYAFLVL